MTLRLQHKQNISVQGERSSDVITKTQAGKTGWVLDTSDEVTDHAYIYADVSDTVLNKIKDYSNIYVTVEYYDSGYGWFKIIYDSLSSILTHSEYVFCKNTGQWKKYTFRLQDAYFNNRINSKYDFYITGYDPTNYKFSGTELIVSKIDVSVDNMKSPAKVNAKTDNIGNIFFDGDEKKFSVDFVNRSASEILAELSYTVYDYDENVADYGYKAVNLEASGSGTYYITPNVDKYGVYTLKLELKNDTVYTVKEYDFSVCPKNNELNQKCGNL